MRFRPRFESLESRENPSAFLAPDVPLPEPVSPSGPSGPPADPAPPTPPRDPGPFPELPDPVSPNEPGTPPPV